MTTGSTSIDNFVGIWQKQENCIFNLNFIVCEESIYPEFNMQCTLRDISSTPARKLHILFLHIPRY